ncbi:MAG: hypothetical protein DRP25_03225 [Thermotoga sp.]|nr:MAG: hypothetical protein DRP25_03225 [Thermotoga sp.]
MTLYLIPSFYMTKSLYSACHKDVPGGTILFIPFMISSGISRSSAFKEDSEIRSFFYLKASMYNNYNQLEAVLWR